MPPGAFSAEGLEFRKLAIPGDDYVEFLCRTVPFQKSTYHFLEAHLRDKGQDKMADKIYREMNRRDRREHLGPWAFTFDIFATNPIRWFTDPKIKGRWKQGIGRLKDNRTADEIKNHWTQRFSRGKDHRTALLPWLPDLFLDVTVGLGTQSHRVGLFLIGLVVALAILFSADAKSVRRTTVTTIVDTVVLHHKLDDDVHPGPDKWSWIDGTSMALRVAFPMLNIFLAKDWEPSGESIGARFITYERIAGTVNVISYVAVPLFLVSVSGLLKRRGD